tara:strand:- start:320 stop:691 length:372 start_codon:yes stop_codon:yes gene_type:complete
MIYKVLTLNEWQSAKESGTIVTEIDQNDGFVHLSTSSQLSATLSMYFKALSEVMLLQINFNKVEKMLKLEATSPNSSRKGSFYHLYGELLIEHVSKYWLLDRGAFNVPDEILVQAEAVDSKIF